MLFTVGEREILLHISARLRPGVLAIAANSFSSATWRAASLGSTWPWPLDLPTPLWRPLDAHPNRKAQ